MRKAGHNNHDDRGLVRKRGSARQGPPKLNLRPTRRSRRGWLDVVAKLATIAEKLAEAADHMHWWH